MLGEVSIDGVVEGGEDSGVPDAPVELSEGEQSGVAREQLARATA